MNPNAYLHEQMKIVQGLAPVTLGGSGEDAVSLKGYQRLTIVLHINNGAAATGAAVTLKQSSDVAESDPKTLAFDTMWANLDCAATDTLVETAVTSDTFDTDDTNGKDLMYVMEVQATDLDVAGGFAVVRLDLVALTDADVSILYLLWPAKDAKATPVSAILD